MPTMVILTLSMVLIQLMLTTLIFLITWTIAIMATTVISLTTLTLVPTMKMVRTLSIVTTLIVVITLVTIEISVRTAPTTEELILTCIILSPALTAIAQNTASTKINVLILVSKICYFPSNICL